MKMKWVIFTGVVLLFFLSGCGSSRKTVTPPKEEIAAAQDESFDPFTLPDDADIVIPRTRVEEKVKPMIEEKKPEAGVVDTLALLKKTISGYRVQIFATNDRNQAYLLKDEATMIFKKDSINVYLEFSDPYYKIRIGDCKTREDAERVRQLAKMRGYSNAFIVKSPVLEFPELMWQNQNKTQ